jgi:hypothetical protein
MNMQRRKFIKNAAMLASGAAIGLPKIGSVAESVTVPAKRSYSYHGQPDDYTDFRVIEPSRVVVPVLNAYDVVLFEY